MTIRTGESPAGIWDSAVFVAVSIGVTQPGAKMPTAFITT
jgi:hypothetical protein